MLLGNLKLLEKRTATRKSEILRKKLLLVNWEFLETVLLLGNQNNLLLVEKRKSLENIKKIFKKTVLLLGNEKNPRNT